MTNTYIWNYVEAEQSNIPIIVDGISLMQFVFLVRFSITVSDGINEATYYNQFRFPEPTSATDYTPASQVTATMIMGWLTDALGTSGVAAMQANADTVLANKLSPPTSVFTPAS